MGRKWSRSGGSPASLQQRLPFTRDDVPDEDDVFSNSSNNLSPEQSRAISSQRTRRRSSGQYLSSSVGRGFPTRSFAHASSGPIETVSYASYGMRDETQQLADLGLERSPAAYQAQEGSVHSIHTVDDVGASNSVQESLAESWDETEGIQRHISRISQDRPQPDAILEVSEPTSPKPDGAHGDLHEAEEITKVSSEHSISSSGASFKRSTGRFWRRSATDVQERPIVDENTTLLSKHKPPAEVGKTSEGQSDLDQDDEGLQTVLSDTVRHLRDLWHIMSDRSNWQPENIRLSTINCCGMVLTALPAVFLGWLLNVLDALSYGTILFPLGEPIFQDTGPDGIAIFFVSTIISQLVYSCFSRFKGGVGSEMIEVVPFFHKMAYLIMAQMDPDTPANVIMSTVYISYIMSSIITGAIFMLLGIFRLGNLVNFFPRSILTGCIGGVGVFLFITGIEVSAGIDGNIEYNLTTLQRLLRLETLPLWTIPLLLAIVLMVLKSVSDRAAIVPSYFIGIFAVFYIIVAAVPNYNLERLREAGWVFEKPRSGVEFYHFYSYYNLRIVNWAAIFQCLPTMLALSFFGILHVPINVPALALAVQADDVNTNQELINHGISNSVSSLAGSIQNYLVYANSSMFIKNGGNSRLAGLLLALATFATWAAGPEAIGYIPKMIVGTLIYLLGIDLVKEALWDTFGRIHKFEYLMIIAIVLIMGFHDFVVGICVGIVLSSLIFVVQTSRISAVRAVFSGSIAESTVRRHPVHRRFLHNVGSQLRVFKLAGYLFFGTIVDVEKQIRDLLRDDEFSRHPIRFLILDFLHVTGIDFSAAEAFVRVKRLLSKRQVTMVLSGINESGELRQSLLMVGLFHGDDEETERALLVFKDLNKALQKCENLQLLAITARSDALTVPSAESPVPAPFTSLRPQPGPLDLQHSSPRQRLLHTVAHDTIASEEAPTSKWRGLPQPLRLMLRTFQKFSEKEDDVDFWYRASTYFDRIAVQKDKVLYSAGDAPNGFYILEEGILRAEYELEQGKYQESIVASTTCGELPFFAGTERNATVYAETDCVAWLLSKKSWKKLVSEWPEGEIELLKIGLKLTAERMEAITRYVLVTAS